MPSPRRGDVGRPRAFYQAVTMRGRLFAHAAAANCKVKRPPRQSRVQMWARRSSRGPRNMRAKRILLDRRPIACALSVGGRARAGGACTDHAVRNEGRGPRRAAAVALHASGKINVRAFRALPVAVSYARGRRAGPPAPVGLLRLGLRCGLLDEDRVPREVRRFSHPCGPVTRSSPVGHFVALCCWALLPRVGVRGGFKGRGAAMGRPPAPGTRSRCECRPFGFACESQGRSYVAAVRH